MIHIYYGPGKGKTSTLNGSAIRASGAGQKVLVIRFLKGRPTSEDVELDKLGIKILKPQTSEKFVIEMDPMEKLQTRNEINTVFKYIRFNSKNYDLVILDEFLDLMSEDVALFSIKEIMRAIEETKTEIMISGHTYIKELFEKADLITHYESEKHYFDKGVNARKGIEY